MRDVGKRERRLAWGASLGIHAGIFLAAAFSGLFVMQMPHDDGDIYDVVFYDDVKTAEAAGTMDDGGASGGGEDGIVVDLSQDSSQAAQELAQDLQASQDQQAQAEPPEQADTADSAQQAAADMGKKPVDVQKKPAAQAQGAAKAKQVAAAGVSREGAADGKGHGLSGSSAGTSSGTEGNGHASGGPGKGANGGSGGGSNGGPGTGDAGQGSQAGAPQGAPARDPELAQQAKTPARLISGASPEYPSDLEGSGTQGQVGLAILVSAAGGVENVSVESSSGNGELDRAAIAAAHTYRFSPARNVYDEPVRSRVHQVVNFVF